MGLDLVSPSPSAGGGTVIDTCNPAHGKSVFHVGVTDGLGGDTLLGGRLWDRRISLHLELRGFNKTVTAFKELSLNLHLSQRP